MANTSQVQPSFRGEYFTDANGKLFHVIGNTFIEVSEHFPQKGQTIPEILKGLIQRSASKYSSCTEHTN